MHLINQKHIKLEKVEKQQAEDLIAKTHVKKENRRLEELIEDMQLKNKQLGELLDDNMYKRAEDFKNKVLGTINGTSGRDPARTHQP